MGEEGAARARELIAQAERGDEPEDDEPLVALLPPNPDKAARTRVHMTVRQHLPMLVSDTVDAPEGEGEGAGGKGELFAQVGRSSSPLTPPAFAARSQSSASAWTGPAAEPRR